MFYTGDKLIATDPYQMDDGECLLTVGNPYQIGFVDYRNLSFSIQGDDGGEIVIGFEEAKMTFDLDNIIQAE